MHPPNEKLCSSESEDICQKFITNWSDYLSLLEDGYKNDLLNLIDALDRSRIKWQNCEAKCELYNTQVGVLQKDINNLNGRLLKCQAQLNNVSNAKKNVENEYALVIEKLQEIVKSNDQKGIYDDLLAIIHGSNNVNNSVTPLNDNIGKKGRTPLIASVSPANIPVERSHSDIEYDRSASSSETSSRPKSSRKRHSCSQAPGLSMLRFDPSLLVEEGCEAAASKRPRNVDDRTKTPSPLKLRANDFNQPQRSICSRRSVSLSTLKIVKEKPSVFKSKARTPLYGRGTIAGLARTPPSSTGSWTRGQVIERRIHRISSFRPLFGSCDVCKKRFGLISHDSLCCVDCNGRFHRNCLPYAPVPCLPKIKSPKSPSKHKAALVSYCPNNHPYIPPILIRCVIALEQKHIDREGIYRLPGIDSAVTKLYDVLMSSRIAPELNNVETETLTGCIKKFLKELRDPLVPASSFAEFMDAIQKVDDDDILASVFALPAPMRDTLAYIILHLQKVAKHSSKNKMPLENLARVLAPTIIGHSTLHTRTVKNASELCHNQFKILLRLLRISSEFWSRFMNNNMSAVIAAEANKPGTQTALLTVTSSSRRTK